MGEWHYDSARKVVTRSVIVEQTIISDDSIRICLVHGFPVRSQLFDWSRSLVTFCKESGQRPGSHQNIYSVRLWRATLRPPLTLHFSALLLLLSADVVHNTGGGDQSYGAEGYFGIHK